MADDFFDYDDDDGAPKRHDNLFVWTVFILLLLGAAFACWLGSFYVFGHPEQARAYAILKKLNKIEPPKRFEETAAPAGEFLTAQRLFERYSAMSRLQLENENALLLRFFVNNFRETKKLVPYVRGNFTIMSAAELNANNFVGQGMVALGVSNDFPQLLIEHLYPMGAENIAKSRVLLVPGNPIKLEKTYDLGSVIHVEKIADGRMLLTVVPLMYGSYALNGGVGTFSTEPPPDLNIAGGLPVVRGDQVEKALKSFADFRRGQPVADPVAPGETPGIVKGPEIVRLDAVPEGVKIPETGALPEMPVATPIPLASARATPIKKPAPLVTMLLKATPREMGVATPIPMTNKAPTIASAATPMPFATPMPNLPAGVIKPFIASNPQPGLLNAQGNVWRTFKPGAAPSGKILGVGDASGFADRGPVPERNYLRGSFVVKASGENRAVLRPRLATGDADPSVRVIVEYPNGAVPPLEGVEMDRDEVRPLQITDVRKGATGELNIWVREIVAQ